MICVVTLFSPTIHRFWRSPEGLNHLSKLFASIAQMGLKAIAVGDDKQLLLHSKGAGAMVIHTAPPNGSNANWEKSIATVTQLLRKQGYTSEDFLFVDYRFLFLTKETLADAINTHSTGKEKILTSVSTVIDHFPQCTTPWAVVSAGLLHLREGKAQSALPQRQYMTRQFVHPWPDDLPDGQYVNIPGMFGFNFSPYHIDDTTLSKEFVWVKQGPQARIHYTPDTDNSYGVAWPTHDGGILPILRKDKETNELSLSFSGLTQDSSFSLWLYPFVGGTINCREVEAHQFNYAQDDIPVQDVKQAGWWYVLAQESEEADFASPYCPPEGKWQLTADLVPIDKETQKHLSQRQDMFSSFIADGCIVIIPAQVSFQENGVDLSKAHLYPLDDFESICIEEDLDIFRAKAMLKSRGPEYDSA